MCNIEFESGSFTYIKAISNSLQSRSCDWVRSFHQSAGSQAVQVAFRLGIQVTESTGTQQENKNTRTIIGFTSVIRG